MSHPDGCDLIPFQGSVSGMKKSFHPCICEKPECVSISKSFRELCDVRGTFVRTPTGNKDKKVKKAERFVRHLCPQKRVKDILSTDSRGKKAKATGVKTRTKKQKDDEEPGRKLQYVAWHHFHPSYITKEALRNGHYVCLDTIPVDFVKKHIQSDGESNGYTAADRWNEEEYFLVPSYPLSKAKDDLEAVKHNLQLHELTEKVTAETIRPSRQSNPQSESPELEVAQPLFVLNDNVDTSETQKENLELKNEVKRLKDAIRYLQERNQRNSPTATSLFDPQASTDAGPEPLTDMKFQGINRLSIASDEYHAEYPQACFSLFRFRSWQDLKDYIEDMHDLPYERPDKTKPLSKFEQCLLTLHYMETDVTLLDISLKYGYKNHSPVSKIVNAWLPLWGEVGKHLSILPGITSTVMDEMLPQSYIDLDLADVGVIEDGKDSPTETVRKDRTTAMASHGNKLDHASFRWLTWSLPCGLNIEHTDAFLARASEKKLNQLWGRYGKLKNIPAGKQVLADKGFDQTTGFYPNYNTVLHPAFLHGHKQFSSEQSAYNLRVCQLRYTCETVYAHVTKCKRLSGVIPRNEFHHFQDLLDWGHGRANLYLPLQMPAKHADYFSDHKRHNANLARKRKRSNNYTTRR